NSRAVGPVSFPPAGAERSQTTLCVLELSATDRTFSIHFAVALIFGIAFTENSNYTHDKLRVAQVGAGAHGCCQNARAIDITEPYLTLNNTEKKVDRSITDRVVFVIAVPRVRCDRRIMART